MLFVRSDSVAEVGQVDDSATGEADQASMEKSRFRLRASGEMIAADLSHGLFEVGGIEGFAAFPWRPMIRLGTPEHAAAIRKVQKASEDKHSSGLDEVEDSHTPGSRKHSKDKASCRSESLAPPRSAAGPAAAATTAR